MKVITTREKLINSAYKLFYEKSFNATSIDDILKDASLNKGSLYHLFKGKKELLLTVIEEKIATGIRDKYSCLNEEANPLEYIKNNLLNTNSFDFKHGCPLNNLVQEMSPVDEDVAKALRDIYLELEDFYFLALRDLDMSDESKKSLSKMMVATVEGAIMSAKSAQDKTPFIEIVTQMFKMCAK